MYFMSLNLHFHTLRSYCYSSSYIFHVCWENPNTCEMEDVEQLILVNGKILSHLLKIYLLSFKS